jgi:hypothetical protein
MMRDAGCGMRDGTSRSFWAAVTGLDGIDETTDFTPKQVEPA